jgi:aminoglycoside phosphotransferase (APT) family kinase protein
MPTEGTKRIEAKIDSAKSIRSGEELDVDRLREYLLASLPGSVGEIAIEQFPSGYSNLTYLLKLGDQELVLRRPPFGNKVKSAHDMGREYRVLSKLCDVFLPAPRPLVFCEDDSVIGADFYVMERRTGVILRKSEPPAELSSSPETVRRLCESLVDCLVELHKVDYEAAGLSDLGRPDGYIERQVHGWRKRYDKAKTDDVQVIDKLGEWLAANIPCEGKPSLIHNDYKYDNVMLDPNDLTKIVAVLDWEMATIGDPLMDLGTTLAYWIGPDDPPEFRQGSFGPTFLDGSFSRQEFADRYAQKMGIDTSQILFHYCYGLCKLAVIVQQIYARYVRGATKDQRFANLNLAVQGLGTLGLVAISNGKI